MHIRQLARNAALITVAAIVTAGFSTGIAQATSAAPTSTISVASAPDTPAGTAPRVLMASCPKYTFCAFSIAGSKQIYLAQSFNCLNGATHPAVPETIYLMINRCTTHAVDYEYKSGGGGCISDNSQRGIGGGFPPIKDYVVLPYADC
jgi:hypothetical protein